MLRRPLEHLWLEQWQAADFHCLDAERASSREPRGAKPLTAIMTDNYLLGVILGNTTMQLECFCYPLAP